MYGATAQAAQARSGEYPICGPFRVLRESMYYFMQGSKALHIFVLLIDVVLFHMAFDCRPFDHPVAADETLVIFVGRLADHFKEAQLQKQVRPSPDFIPKPANGNFVYSQSSS